LGDFEVVRRAGNYLDFDPGPFEEAGFVCSDEGVGEGFVEGTLSRLKRCAPAVSSGLDDALTGNGAGG